MLRVAATRAAMACPRAPLGRALSAGSHSDFQPKLRTSGSADAAEIIREQVTQNKVMLYMKGTPASPMCGFSSQVIRILDVTGEPPTCDRDVCLAGRVRTIDDATRARICRRRGI